MKNLPKTLEAALSECDKRVLAFIQAHPNCSRQEVMTELKITREEWRLSTDLLATFKCATRTGTSRGARWTAR